MAEAIFLGSSWTRAEHGMHPFPAAPDACNHLPQLHRAVQFPEGPSRPPSDCFSIASSGPPSAGDAAPSGGHAQSGMSITSDELNFLVYRYLHESGFRHSAFTFGAESSVAKSNINGAKIPPGQLINFVQKGIMYSELERSVSDDGVDQSSSEPFSLRRPSDAAESKGGGSSDGPPPAKKQATGGSSSDGHGANGTSHAAASSVAETSDDQVTTLAGHTSEVFICAWSPTGMLASGSGDSTARIWRVPEGPCGARSPPMADPAVLQHFSNDKEVRPCHPCRPRRQPCAQDTHLAVSRAHTSFHVHTPPTGCPITRPPAAPQKSKDVTTLDWSPTGSALATGSYDGQARIWSPSGKLTTTLARHKGPIFSLKWNSTGRYLLSGSVDKTAIIWDAQTGDVKQQVRPPTPHARTPPPPRPLPSMQCAGGVLEIWQPL